MTLIFVWKVFVLVSYAQAASNTIEQKLIHYLLSNYSRMSMPVIKTNTTVNVQLGLELIQILQVAAPEQMMGVIGWIRLSWKNELLVWDPSKFGGINVLRLCRDSVWIPDITLYNSFEQISKEDAKSYEQPSSPVVLHSNGEQHYNFPTVRTFTCEMSARDFPTDMHTCTMEYGSWSFNQKQINLSTDNLPMITSQYITNTEWELLGTRKNYFSSKYQCCTTPYSKVTFQITIRRKDLFYKFTTYLPCIIVMLCLLVGHLLPPQTGEKVTLCLSVLLTFFVFLQTTSSNVPRSEELSSMGLFLLLGLSGIALSTFVTCLVLRIYFMDEETSTPPSFCKSTLYTYLSRVLYVSTPTQGTGNLATISIQDCSVAPTTNCKESMKSHYNRKRSRVRNSYSFPMRKHPSKLKRTLTHRLRRGHEYRGRDQVLEERFGQVLDSVRKIREEQRETKANKDIGDWQKLGIVVDRSAFLVFTLLTLVAIVWVFS